MKLTRFFWLTIIFIGLLFISFSPSDADAVSPPERSILLQPQSGIPLTILDGAEIGPDLAYDPSHNQSLLAYQYKSTSETPTYSIQAQFVSSGGTPVNAPLLLSAEDSILRRNPAVAYNSAAGEFLVIWDHEFNPTDHDRLKPAASHVILNGSGLGGFLSWL
jgi:hypothetical protein